MPRQRGALGGGEFLRTDASDAPDAPDAPDASDTPGNQHWCLNRGGFLWGGELRNLLLLVGDVTSGVESLGQHLLGFDLLSSEGLRGSPLSGTFSRDLLSGSCVDVLVCWCTRLASNHLGLRRRDADGNDSHWRGHVVDPVVDTGVIDKFPTF